MGLGFRFIPRNRQNRVDFGLSFKYGGIDPCGRAFCRYGLTCCERIGQFAWLLTGRSGLGGRFAQKVLRLDLSQFLIDTGARVFEKLCCTVFALTNTISQIASRQIALLLDLLTNSAQNLRCPAFRFGKLDTQTFGNTGNLCP